LRTVVGKHLPTSGGLPGRPGPCGIAVRVSYLADPNLAFVCASVMEPGDFARARPHLVAMGAIAGLIDRTRVPVDALALDGGC